MGENEIVQKDVERERKKYIYIQIVKKYIDSEKNRHCGKIDSVKKIMENNTQSGKKNSKKMWKNIYR